MQMNHTARNHIAKAIYVTAWIATLAVAWQAVRFCQGHIGAIALDQIIALTTHMWGEKPEDLSSEVLTSPFFLIMSHYFKVLYLVGGIGAWILCARVVLVTGLSLGRALEVGFENFTVERRSANNAQQLKP